MSALCSKELLDEETINIIVRDEATHKNKMFTRKRRCSKLINITDCR